MTNVEKMKSYLRKYVFPQLYEKGFTGKWPHFRRELDDCIELVSFDTNKWGGSFTVEVSAVFPNSDNKNFARPTDEFPEEELIWCTNRRYRLKGMYDGWFYYRDIYAKYVIGFGKSYYAVPENQAADFVPTKGYKLVRKFDDETALWVCDEVNRQMENAYKWLANFEKKNLKNKNKSKGGTQ